MKEYGPFGKTTGNQNFTLADSFILGFIGRSNNHLNSIGVYSLAPIDVYGSFDRNFREYPDTEFPPAVKYMCTIAGSWMLFSFSTSFMVEKREWGGIFGETNENHTIIQFGPDEELIGVKGEIAYAGTFKVLYQLTFISQNKKCATQTVYRSFGPNGEETFDI